MKIEYKCQFFLMGLHLWFGVILSHKESEVKDGEILTYNNLLYGFSIFH